MATTARNAASRREAPRSMLHQFLYGVLALVCLLAAGLSARGARADTLDQQNAPAQWSGGAHHITSRSTQTVSPTLGCLTRVEVALMTGNRGKGGDKVTLTVLDWSAISTVKQLASVTLDVAEGFDNWLSFTIPGGGVAVPSHWLALQLNDTGKNVFWWKYQSGNPYPGGFYLLGGYGNDSYDYLFRTYGTPGCAGTPGSESFTLAVAPDPVPLARGGSAPATVSVARQGGFSGPVSVTFTLPAGVTATPSTLNVTGASAGVTLSASATAGTGSFTATARGTGSGVAAAQASFKVSVGTGTGAVSLAAVTPPVQQRGGTITLTGSGFSTSCAQNTVTIAGIGTTAQTCTATSLTATVPAGAAYGATTVGVNVAGAGQSNTRPFTVARAPGAFVDITADVIGQHASKACTAGTARVDVAASGGSNYSAVYKRVPAGSGIGSPIAFDANNSYLDAGGTTIIVGNVGGAGFSLCSTGLVFDGNGSGQPRLVLRDLDSGASYQASPVEIPMKVPRLAGVFSEYYKPHFLRSPDGTILLVVSAAPQSGTGNAMATFLDKAAGGTVLNTVRITTPSTIGTTGISASVGTDNRISLQFGNQTFGPYAIP